MANMLILLMTGNENMLILLMIGNAKRTTVRWPSYHDISFKVHYNLTGSVVIKEQTQRHDESISLFSITKQEK
jgi:hypothetical protein